MRKISLLKFLLIPILVTSCSASREPLTVMTVEKDKPKLDLPMPPPVKLKVVEFKILKDRSPAMIGITVDHYKNLAENVESMKVYIQKQIEIIKAYKKYNEE